MVFSQGKTVKFPPIYTNMERADDDLDLHNYCLRPCLNTAPRRDVVGGLIIRSHPSMGVVWNTEESHG